MCLQPMTLHSSSISPAASEQAVCKCKRRHFLPGEFLTFSGENMVSKVGTIHILDVGQRLLFLNKSKFNSKCIFHSL